MGESIVSLEAYRIGEKSTDPIVESFLFVCCLCKENDEYIEYTFRNRAMATVSELYRLLYNVIFSTELLIYPHNSTSYTFY